MFSKSFPNKSLVDRKFNEVVMHFTRKGKTQQEIGEIMDKKKIHLVVMFSTNMPLIEIIKYLEDENN